MPATAILFDLKVKRRIYEFLRWIGLAAISIVIAYAIYSILRLSPYFNIIGDKNSTFVYPFSEWLNHPFNFLFGNLNGLMDWLISYATIPLFLAVVVSFFLGGAKYLREKLLLLAWFMLPFVALALFGKVLYPRFILFMTMPLLVLASFSLGYIMENVRSKYLMLVMLVFPIILLVRSDYYILNDFAHAPIADADINQFINAWPAGGGYKQLVSYLNKEAENKKIFVYTEGTFGSLPTNTIEIYLDHNKNVGKKGIWPIPNDIPDEVLQTARDMKTFFVFNQSQKPPQNWLKYLKFITRYQKGIGDYYMTVYEVIPES